MTKFVVIKKKKLNTNNVRPKELVLKTWHNKYGV